MPTLPLHLTSLELMVGDVRPLLVLDRNYTRATNTGPAMSLLHAFRRRKAPDRLSTKPVRFVIPPFVLCKISQYAVVHRTIKTLPILSLDSDSMHLAC